MLLHAVRDQLPKEIFIREEKEETYTKPIHINLGNQAASQTQDERSKTLEFYIVTDQRMTQDVENNYFYNFSHIHHRAGMACAATTDTYEILPT